MPTSSCISKFLDIQLLFSAQAGTKRTHRQAQADLTSDLPTNLLLLPLWLGHSFAFIYLSLF